MDKDDFKKIEDIVKEGNKKGDYNEQLDDIARTTSMLLAPFISLMSDIKLKSDKKNWEYLFSGVLAATILVAADNMDEAISISRGLESKIIKLDKKFIDMSSD